MHTEDKRGWRDLIGNHPALKRWNYLSTFVYEVAKILFDI
jgi:hypothetical protein